MEEADYLRAGLTMGGLPLGNPGLFSVPSGSLPDELIRRLSVYDPVRSV